MSRTLVAFHAHPDDEALLTSGTMAKAAAEGHRVVLVVATQGEVGDAAGRLLGAGEDLGELRSRETEASAEVLGVARLEFLGYRDSGVAGDAGGNTFVAADLDEAAERLAAVLRAEQADVLTTYDPNGGYGHADHLKVHAVGRRAAELAGTPLLLEATINRDLLRLAADLAPTLGFEIPDGVIPDDQTSWFAAAEEITHHIDVTAYLDQKRASMAAHASQTTSDVSTTRSLQLFLSLPDDLFATAFGTEWFIDRQRPGATITDVFVTDDG